MKGGEGEVSLNTAKREYKAAAAEGNHEEEARWANVIGDILKRRGEYVESLRWLRVDYDVSVKYLPQKQLLPTCQSLGELYLRLDRCKEALIYQKKHLQLAKDSNNLIEQQRASTQLGRTYHEMFLKSENDHYAVRNAKKYFKSAMKFARMLKESHPCNKSSLFLKEFIDAHNNLGLLEMDLDNIEEAQKILLQGLKICEEEEISENDDTRSRLHHNLGSLYMELRQWVKAREHIERDILICKKIEHLQGEAKGFINLGVLHSRMHKYEEALCCYQKALSIAKSMEDEDALVDQICQNIQIVKEAIQVLGELGSEEKKLKQLIRMTGNSKGTPDWRRCLLEQNSCLDHLIEKANTIFAWQKHLEFAKRKKNVAKQIHDMEKLSDSYLAIGESYQKLRNFSKARKWYMKSWMNYRRIRNLEGQALAKINIGEVQDSSGDWAGALEAFEEGYRIAVQGSLLSVQLAALNNMHYSHMIRFDNVEEARKVQHDIQNLKHLLMEEDEVKNLENEYCSETETEGVDMSDNLLGACDLLNTNETATSKPKLSSGIEDCDDDVPLVSPPIRPVKSTLNSKMLESNSYVKRTGEDTSNCWSKSTSTESRKRVRVVMSDDEVDDHKKFALSRERLLGSPREDVATSDGDKKRNEPINLDNEEQDITHPSDSRDVLSACTPIHLEESTCSFKSKSTKSAVENGMKVGCLSAADNASASKIVTSGPTKDRDVSTRVLQNHDAGFHLPNSEDEHGCTLAFKIGHEIIHLDVCACMDGDKLSTECTKVEVACLYYLQLSEEKKSKGLLPVIRDLKLCGRDLGSVEAIEMFNEDCCIEVTIDEWVPKRLMKSYMNCCQRMSEVPNMKLLRKLYKLEISEDEVDVSGCGLQDISILPFLDALDEHNILAVIDISHNLLGNETMEKLQRIFTSSDQRYGGLTLDLHCNRFGPTALFQICECPVLLARLEVLNLSENRLTDTCASYLSTILGNCKALYSLNIEQCSITSRTIQIITDALDDGSVLSQLSIGKNYPISGKTMVGLLSKLSTLKRFSELSLNGIKLNKPAVESLCQLVISSSLLGLMLGETIIGSDAAVRLTNALSSSSQELVKFDISYCGLTSPDFSEVCANIYRMSSVLEFNVGGNSIKEEGSCALEPMLVDPQCNLKVLILNKCQLGLRGILRLIQALADNDSLEELHLAENTDVAQEAADISKSSCERPCAVNESAGLCAVNSVCDNLEVADSEDELVKVEPTSSAVDGSCTTCLRNPIARCQLVEVLSTAIGLAKRLQLLDLSRNGFSLEVVETLYTAWASSGTRLSIAQKHVYDQTVHFSVKGKKCCGINTCCRRDRQY